MTSYSPRTVKRIVTFLALLIAGNFAHGQTLSLTSGSVPQGSSLSLNLSLSGGTSAPAGLQWKLTYPANDVTALTATAGPVLTAAGKTLNCVAGSGSLTCLASGMNTSSF